MSPHLLPGFRYLPGMLATVKGRRIPFRIGAVGSGRYKGLVYLVHPKLGIGEWGAVSGDRPQLPEVTGIVANDPATGGCLAQLLGESVDDVWFDPVSVRWHAWTGDGYRSCPTLGAACVAVATALIRWPG